MKKAIDKSQRDSLQFFEEQRQEVDSVIKQLKVTRRDLTEQREKGALHSLARPSNALCCSG